MGYIYLFKQKGTQLTKIGMTDSDDVTSRFNMFKMYSPHGAEITLTIQTNNPFEVEKKIHRQYSHKRVGGEFFNLSPEEINDIEKLYRGSDTSNLRSLFEEWISDPKNDIIKLQSVFEQAKKSPPPQSQKIISFLKENYLGMNLTSTEIQRLLADHLAIFINSVPLGFILKSAFERKSEKRSGMSQKVYMVR